MRMWSLHERTSEEQARINRGRSNDGKNTQVEDTAPLDDDYDVNIGLAGCGVVYDTSQSYYGAVGPCECGDGSHDRCVCGMDGT